MAITNNLKVFANTLTSASEGEFANGVSSGGYIYADTLNTALRTSSVVTYGLIEALKELGTNGAYTISAISESADVKDAIKDSLHKLVSGASVAYATKAGSATSATTATSATSANSATIATKLAEGVGSATEPVYVDTDGTVKKCTGINVPGSVTSATNATNVTNTIAGKKITDIFEGDGTTVSKAKEATEALNVSGAIGGINLTDIFESSGGQITKQVKLASKAGISDYLNAWLYIVLNGTTYDYHGGRSEAENKTVTFYAPTTLGTKNYLVCATDDGLSYVNPSTLSVANARYADEAGMASVTEQPLTINVNGTTKTFNGSEAVSVNAGNVVPFVGTEATLTKVSGSTAGSLYIGVGEDQDYTNALELTLLQTSRTMNPVGVSNTYYKIEVDYTTKAGGTGNITLYRKMLDGIGLGEGTEGNFAKIYQYGANTKCEILNCSLSKDGTVMPSIMYNKVNYITITLDSESDVQNGEWKFQLVGTKVV